MEIVQQLEALEADMAIARTQLASLMNLPPATAVTVAVPGDAAPALAKPGYKLEDLEAIAMWNGRKCARRPISPAMWRWKPA